MDFCLCVQCMHILWYVYSAVIRKIAIVGITKEYLILYICLRVSNFSLTVLSNS